MKISKILAIVISFLFSATAYAGLFEDGLAAIRANNYTLAFEKFRLAAVQGNSNAQRNLGFMYNKGEGVVQDFAEAAKWYKLAAAQGDSLAQRELARMYLIGKGVVQDDAEAFKWFKLAAAQGDSLAQSNLGFMYNNGKGVAQDYAEAAKWFKLAAAQGDSLAQFSLGVMYGKGLGVVQDYMLTHMWSNLAAAHMTEEFGLKTAISNRDTAANMLTPQQIAQAQNMARTCQSSKFTKCDNPYGAPVPKQVARPTQQPKIVYVPVPTPPIATQNGSFGSFDSTMPMLPVPPIRLPKSTTCRKLIDEITCTEDF